MKICGYCGSQLDDSAVACSYCGRVIVGDGDPEAAREHAREAEQAARKQEQAGAAYNQGPGWQQNRPTQGPGWQQNNQNRQDAGPSAGGTWQQNPQGQSGTWQQNQQTQGAGWQQNQQTQGGAWQQNQQTQGAGWQQNPQGQGAGWQQDPQGSWQQNAPYQQPMYGPEETRKTNVCGLVSFILGLVSIIGGAIYLLPPIAAIVLAIVALVQHSRRPQMYSQKGFAIAGLVLGIIFLIFWGAVFVYTFSMMNSFMNSGGSLEDIQGLLDYLQNNFGGFFFLK